jgi:hypothetical protein
MNTTLRGSAFEDTIYDLLASQIEQDGFWARRDCCKLFKKKGYYSRDRGSDIIFDVSIEISLPGAEGYSLLVLVECKDYKTLVPVNDVEEFAMKVSQVAGANVKGVLASTTAFQKGALRFAQSRGFGVLRHFGGTDHKWVLKRSVSWSGSDGRFAAGDGAEGALTDESFVSSYHDSCFFANGVTTYSSNRMFEALCFQGNSDESAAFIEQVSNPKKQAKPVVPFIEKADIDQFAIECLAVPGYKDGAVDLTRICEWQRREIGLVVTHHDKPSPDGITLGALCFEPLTIEIFNDAGRPDRARFTLAHELGHLLLQHDRLMVRELTEAKDLRHDSHRSLDSVDVRRMEWQANYFAACVLLPLGQFNAHLARVIGHLRLYDRGFGLLYVDDQPGNIHNFMVVTSYLKAAFAVSRQAIVIRLTQLGYLRDVRGETWTRL